MKPKKHLLPPGGFWFREKDGTEIRANSWDGVVRLVANYRRRNRLEPGAPEHEVLAQAAARSPEYFANGDMSRPKPNLKARVFEWLSHFRRLRDRAEHIRLVDDGLVNARAAVCINCPHHTNVAGGCGSCKRALAGLRSVILKGRTPDVRLGACAVIANDLQVGTMLDEPTLDAPNLPGHCWRRRTL